MCSLSVETIEPVDPPSETFGLSRFDDCALYSGFATMHARGRKVGRMFDVYDFSRPVDTSVSTLADWTAVGTIQPTLYQRFCKRGVDLVLSVIALIVLIPVLLVIAGMVRLKLGPGVLYRQVRVGRNGRNFVMLKFRTMRHRQAEETDDGDEHPTFKTSEHPRLTEFGRVLRRLSLDELPQLWNVIRGQMSLVGPRPELSREGRRLRPAVPPPASRSSRADR